ncbi:hypothetical protein FACS1894145_0930 [Bacteroidia bacterium]|nr:hypothetical protein FACS1894145_0930 [Bacteroidia bacterium]
MSPIELRINDDILLLTPVPDENNEELYYLQDDSGESWLKMELKGREFKIIDQNKAVNSSQDEINAKLGQLVLDIIESEQSGTENTEFNNNEENEPYNPDDIKVSSKSFSTRFIKEMIADGSLELTPDFQRHLVWDQRQRSRLIESILLKIPLPVFYFSEDTEGKLTVIDGLQRLSAINDFMNNKFQLKGLEYLRDNCEGKSYETLELKYIRWFNQTQLIGNVIDPSSPYKVKYDIFKRINTGGEPLKNQEIRNCLTGKALRETLQEMVSLPEFKKATDYSISPVRMADEEMALRFILFRLFKSGEKGIEEYNGYMDSWLDELTDIYRKATKGDLQYYIADFSTAMKNADYLFGGKYAFRKIRIKDIRQNAPKQLINKALFVSWSVLLADYEFERIIIKNKPSALLKPLAEAIETDTVFRNYLSNGTNNKANIQSIFFNVEKIINKHLIY